MEDETIFFEIRRIFQVSKSEGGKQNAIVFSYKSPGSNVEYYSYQESTNQFKFVDF